jgi:hypothetical protein
MDRKLTRPWAAVEVLASLLSPLRAEDAKSVLKVFADPPREYSTGPLWTWNDLLTEEQVVAALGDLAAQKVRQVWVHPQPGLMTP